MELGRGLRSRLGSRTVEVWETWARCSLRMRISSGTWLECDLQCGPSCVSVSASCVVEQPGRFWGRGGAGWVSSHARNLPHLALADSRDSTNPCHCRQNLGRLRMPPVLHRISPATIIRASSLALLLVHGRHAIDKARLLGKRNNLTFTTAQRLFVPGPGTRERKSGTMITTSGLLDQVPAQNDSFPLSTLPPCQWTLLAVSTSILYGPHEDQ